MKALFKNFQSEIREFRRLLHQNAELSGREIKTSGLIREFLSKYSPDSLYMISGGYGLIAKYEGKNSGKNILLRSELDALPISERTDLDYRSKNPHVSHSCGHDGHSAILASVGAYLSSNRPENGTVFLLFQPSEENAAGASSVLKDTYWKDLDLDYVFALHNLPGFPLNSVILREGLFALSSIGLEIQLTGLSSHASEPEKGINPAFVMADIVKKFSDTKSFLNEFSKESILTIIHLKLGEESYGTNPGSGKILVTVRAPSNSEMQAISEKCEQFARQSTMNSGIDISFKHHDEFPATVNNPGAVKIVETVADNCKMKVIKRKGAFPWSEDFGHFTAKFPGALFGLGAGQNQPPLHNPDYNFPEDLLQTGFELFINVINESLK